MLVDNPKYFFCQTAALARFRGSPPRAIQCAKPGPLNKIEEFAVLQKDFKLGYGVPPELLVFEVEDVLCKGSHISVEVSERARVGQLGLFDHLTEARAVAT